MVGVGRGGRGGCGGRGGRGGCGGCGVVVVLLWCCRRVVVVLSSCCRRVVVVLSLCCRVVVMLLLYCCVVVLLCVVSLFHCVTLLQLFSACDVTTKLAPDAPPPRRNKLRTNCSRNSTHLSKPSHLHARRRAPRTPARSLSTVHHTQTAPARCSLAAKCCSSSLFTHLHTTHHVQRQDTLLGAFCHVGGSLHAKLKSIASFTVADVVSTALHTPYFATSRHARRCFLLHSSAQCHCVLLHFAIAHGQCKLHVGAAAN